MLGWTVSSRGRFTGGREGSIHTDLEEAELELDLEGTIEFSQVGGEESERVLERG